MDDGGCEQSGVCRYNEIWYQVFWCGVANYLNTVWYGGVKGNALR